MHPAWLISQFLNTPWALKSDWLRTATAFLLRDGGAHNGAPAPMSLERADRTPATRGRSVGAIAVIPIYGVISQRGGSLFDMIFGGGSVGTERVSRALQEAQADPAVAAIVLDVDSPGGSVYGVEELASEIYAARTRKPVVAIANSLAASAAYWIASAATEVYIAPGGEVGSIGVWNAHTDYSKLFAEMGIETTLVSAGAYKTEGNPYEPLSAEARDFMQSRVNDYYGAFTRTVARNRQTTVAKVRDGMGQGRVLGAAAAKAENMVDGIATFSEVLQRAGQLQRAAPGKASASELRERHLAILDDSPRRKASARELRERDL